MSTPLDGLALRTELMRRGLEQRELAYRAGVSEGTLSRACRGRRVSPSTFRKIAEALAATPVSWAQQSCSSIGNPPPT